MGQKAVHFNSLLKMRRLINHNQTTKQAHVMFAEVGEAPAPRRPFAPKPGDVQERERPPRDLQRDMPPPRDLPPRELPPRPSAPAQKADDDFFAEMAREAREEDERERQAAELGAHTICCLAWA